MVWDGDTAMVWDGDTTWYGMETPVTGITKDVCWWFRRATHRAMIELMASTCVHSYDTDTQFVVWFPRKQLLELYW